MKSPPQLAGRSRGIGGVDPSLSSTLMTGNIGLAIRRHRRSPGAMPEGPAGEMMIVDSRFEKVVDLLGEVLWWVDEEGVRHLLAVCWCPRPLMCSWCKTPVCACYVEEDDVCMHCLNRDCWRYRGDRDDLLELLRQLRAQALLTTDPTGNAAAVVVEIGQILEIVRTTDVCDTELAYVTSTMVDCLSDEIDEAKA